MSGYWSVIAIVAGAWLSGFAAGRFWEGAQRAIEDGRRAKEGEVSNG